MARTNYDNAILRNGAQGKLLRAINRFGKLNDASGLTSDEVAQLQTDIGQAISEAAQNIVELTGAAHSVQELEFRLRNLVVMNDPHSTNLRVISFNIRQELAELIG